MDMEFMDEYYERMRADEIDRFAGQRNDEYASRADDFSEAKKELVEALGLTHLFDRSHELNAQEKKLWLLFDRVDCTELLARDAFAKRAYMQGASDREKMVR